MDFCGIDSGLTIEDLNLLKVYLKLLWFVCELIDLGGILDKVAKEGENGWNYGLGISCGYPNY